MNEAHGGSRPRKRQRTSCTEQNNGADPKDENEEHTDDEKTLHSDDLQVVSAAEDMKSNINAIQAFPSRFAHLTCNYVHG